MKVETIINGTVKIVLIPETDLEKMALQQLAKQEVETQEINQQTQILDKIIHDGLVIKTKI